MDDTTIDDRFDLGDDEDDDLDSASGRPQAAGVPSRAAVPKDAEKTNGKGTPHKPGDPNKPSDATTVDIPLDWWPQLAQSQQAAAGIANTHKLAVRQWGAAEVANRRGCLVEGF
jgi:hypothetical protein